MKINGCGSSPRNTNCLMTFQFPVCDNWEEVPNGTGVREAPIGGFKFCM